MKKLYVVGIGPGRKNGMTAEADMALRSADVIAGYAKYVDLVRPHYPDKEFLSTGMTREVERCRAALELAVSGKTVALVCSGDSGIYGMAGLVYELSAEFPGAEIVIVAGVTAAASGAASSAPVAPRPRASRAHCSPSPAGPSSSRVRPR